MEVNAEIKKNHYFSENEFERTVLLEYRNFISISSERKVKRADLWAVVEKGLVPIGRKMFDEILRRFCYAQGQHWALKPKLKWTDLELKKQNSNQYQVGLKMGEKPRISSLEILSKYLKAYLSYNVTSTAKIKFKVIER